MINKFVLKVRDTLNAIHWYNDSEEDRLKVLLAWIRSEHQSCQTDKPCLLCLAEAAINRDSVKKDCCGNPFAIIRQSGEVDLKTCTPDTPCLICRGGIAKLGRI